MDSISFYQELGDFLKKRIFTLGFHCFVIVGLKRLIRDLDENCQVFAVVVVQG